MSEDNLPRWDLSDLYSSIESLELKNDKIALTSMVEAFYNKHYNNIIKYSALALFEAISEYEKIVELMSRLMSFAFLTYSTQINDNKIAAFYQNMQDEMTKHQTKLLFFTLDINNLSEKKIEEMLQDDKLIQYQPWLRDLRAFKPYQLSEHEEMLMAEKDLTSSGAWQRLFDDYLSRIRFPFQGQNLTCSQIVDKMVDPNPKHREEAGKIIGKVLGEHIHIFSLIMNTLVKDKSINDKYRKFPHPISARNLSNFVEDEVVMTLIQTVKNNYTHLSHRYYKIKAKMMGNDHLNYWDRNAPLATQEQKFSWEEAVDIVLISYAQFSPKLAELGKKFFDNNWIDVPMLAGKRHGAFAHPVVPSVHPYLMLNYNGNIRDVSTLAHELGHGVHMLLAAKQGPLMCDTPLTLAETASVFGEQLTFRYLLNLETDSSQRRNMIMHKIEDMLNTVVRQIAFCDFELRIHEERKNGELLPESLGKIWLEVSKESLGPVLIFDNDYQNFWAYIPHLIHSPFYVYSYAFGDCLVNSLYQTYLEKSVDNFEDKYFDMLSAGGILHYRDLLKPFNLDPTNPKFWQKGLDIIAQFIDEIE